MLEVEKKEMITHEDERKENEIQREQRDIVTGSRKEGNLMIKDGKEGRVVEEVREEGEGEETRTNTDEPSANKKALIMKIIDSDGAKLKVVNVYQFIQKRGWCL